MKHALALPSDQVGRIEMVLDELLAKTRAAYVFLADISGQLLNVRGRTGDTDVFSLAALTASNMAATAEMSRLVGERDQFHLLYHEGQDRNIYLSHVARSFLLAVVFDAGVQIGLIRLYSRRAVEELSAVTEGYEAFVSSAPPIMEVGFDAALDAELERIIPEQS